MTYNTKQKDKILDIIKSYNREFTIKDIYNNLDGVGLTTIYRYIDKLVNNNILKKSVDENNTTCYEYLEDCSNDNHFYLKCDKCKRMIHIDCDCINELKEHIKFKHNFKLNEKLIINGLCEVCKNEKNI